MTDKQKILLKDSGFALLPYEFNESIINHCNYKYENEGIKNPENEPIANLGKFWKFIEGVNYLEINNDDTIVIQQTRDQKNACLVPLLYGVDKITVQTNNDIKDYNLESSVFKDIGVNVIDIDFDNPIKKLILHFNFDLAEPLEINVENILYTEPEVDLKQEYFKSLNASHSIGQDLVNIRFQLANNEVLLTKISLFNDEKQLMASYEVKDGIFFKVIKDLAYGKYFYKIEQFDKNNNLIIETDYAQFVLSAPNYKTKPSVYR